MIDPDSLSGLLLKDEKAICEVYLQYFPSVEKYVLMNNGNAQDAEDIFQDTVMVLLAYIIKEDFKLTCTIKTLLFASARRLWLKQIAKPLDQGNSDGARNRAKGLCNTVGRS
jgi:DNA-directed RNA polymerase specialized sigma24 family protein